jgi:hypothetical protein
MLNGYDASLDNRLEQAELAETELAKLSPLAAEAPQLREAKAKANLAAERRTKKSTAMDEARKATDSATEMQRLVPEFLSVAAKAVKEFYSLLREIDGNRQTAIKALTIVDRVDYDVELEEGEARELAMDRDPRGLAYALAAHHGDTKIHQLLEQLDPEFSYLRDCYMDEPLQRDLANFVVTHAVQRSQAPSPKAEQKPAVPQAAVPIEA